jgi:hypothetical protein
MSKRAQFLALGLVCFLLGCLVSQRLALVRAQADVKGPEWLHGLSLSCRKSKEADFTKDTQKFGIEVFRDKDNGNLIYVSETGSIAVVPGK